MDILQLKAIFKKKNRTAEELLLLKAYLSKLKFFQQLFD
jgi:hypothetical protein